MKKMYKFVFAVAAAATALVGCVREPEMLPVAEEHPIQFVAESIGTRTAFDDPTGNTYPTLWTENDQNVRLWLHLKNGKTASVTPSPDGTSATFTASFRDTTIGYKFFALSPSTAYYSHDEYVSNVKKYRLGVTVPANQTPSAKSVDEAAQILVAQTDLFETIPSTVSFQFRHWTAYGKMSLSNLNLNGGVVEAVELTSEVDWAGVWYYFFSDGTTAPNATSNTITVNTTTTDNIWFACAPVDLSGKKLTVTVKTDKGTISKEFTMPANRQFVSGQVARFTANMSGAIFNGPKVYELVTSSSELLYDSKIIIAAARNNYAISTNQKASNRAAVAVVKTDNKIIDPSNDVEIFTLEYGSDAGTYSFKTSAGYLSATGGTSSNQLKTIELKDTTSSWNISFLEGRALVKANLKANGARSVMQYNPNSGTPIFACYSNYSNSRDSVALYKLVGSGGGEPPVEKQDPNMRITTLNLTLAVGDTGDASVESIATDYDGDISYTSSNTAVATVDEDGIVTAVGAGTCTVTVTASETEHYLSATKTCNVTVTSGTKTIAELLALKPATAGQTTEESYEMNEATVMAISGSNVIVKDATGVMLLYKGSTGFVAGDRVTATGKMQNYYGLAEFSATTTAKVSSGATVDHGTAVAMDEAAITSYASAPFVQYAKLTGTLPADSNSSSYMTVGGKNVALYVKTMYASYYSMQADVYGYTIGMGGSGQLNFINTSIDVNSSAPFLTVDVTSKTWAATETDACTVNVTVETGGSWTYTATSMDWATLVKSGNTLVVTPTATNTSSSSKEGSVVFANGADATKTATVIFTQSGTGNVSFVEINLNNFEEGQYVIAGKKGTKTYIMKNAVQSNYYTAATEFDLTDGTEPAAENIFTIKKSGSGYTIQGNDGKYVYIAVSGTYYNLLPNSTSAYVWTLAAGSNGGVLATGSNSNGNAMSFDASHSDFTTSKSPTCPSFYRIVK